jgi:hypothetical protein
MGRILTMIKNGSIIDLNELAKNMIKNETTSLEIVYNHGNAEILFNFSIKKATLKKDNGETVEIVPDYKNNKIIRSEYNGND